MTKHFAAGFFVGFLLFLLLNLLAAHLSSDCGLLAVFRLDPCFDDVARVGWPLKFYEEGGFVFHLELNVWFLLINLWVGIAMALAGGWFLSRGKTSLSK